MFKEDPNPTFEVRISGFVPARPADSLMVTFRYKDTDQLAEWHASFANRTMGEVLDEVIDSWRDAPMPYSAEALEKISKKYPAFLNALLDGYRRELFEAKAKN